MRRRIGGIAVGKEGLRDLHLGKKDREIYIWAIGKGGFTGWERTIEGFKLGEE